MEVLIKMNNGLLSVSIVVISVFTKTINMLRQQEEDT